MRQPACRPATLRPAWAEIDLAAIRHNARVLAELAAPGPAVRRRQGGRLRARRGRRWPGPPSTAAPPGWPWPWSRRAWSCERPASTAPILLLSEPPPPAMAEVVAAALDPDPVHAGRPGRAGDAPCERPGAGRPVRRARQGRHRDAPGRRRPRRRGPAGRGRRQARPGWRLEGFWTHLAVADEVDDPYTADQLARFEAALAGLARRRGRTRRSATPPTRPAPCGTRPAATTWSAAGSPCTAWRPTRPGSTGARCPACARRWRLKARVSHVKEAAGRRAAVLRPALPARARLGGRHRPLGYADGVTRALSATGGEVLIGGRRLPDRRDRHHGPDPRRLRARGRASPSVTRWSCSASQGDERSPPGSGPGAPGPSPTRWSAA